MFESVVKPAVFGHAQPKRMVPQPNPCLQKSRNPKSDKTPSMPKRYGSIQNNQRTKTTAGDRIRASAVPQSSSDLNSGYRVNELPVAVAARPGSFFSATVSSLSPVIRRFAAASCCASLSLDFFRSAFSAASSSADFTVVVAPATPSRQYREHYWPPPKKSKSTTCQMVERP